MTLGATTSSKNTPGPESFGWVRFQGLVHKDPQLKFLVLKFHGEIKTLRFQRFSPRPAPSEHQSQCSVQGEENLQYFGNWLCPSFTYFSSVFWKGCKSFLLVFPPSPRSVLSLLGRVIAAFVLLAGTGNDVKGNGTEGFSPPLSPHV